MALIRINTSTTTTFLLLSLLTILFLITLSSVEGFKVATTTNIPIQALQEKGIITNTKIGRKLAMIKVEAVLDYDDAEPNPRHDPRRRRSNP
ncbi:uncharacterized protein LOC115716955 [Cannabis sativa]|uniref:uncharacterized protein LOC115716955 n=1 Tax=Cannabis sativa TaxID=3483 RepID=UPI0029C9CD56|nr:uncharacterized protein LOC115716955 [Cannabis sativa]